MDTLLNVYTTPNYGDLVSNATVYGLADAVRRSKYAMATNHAAVNSELTPGILGLAQSEPGCGHDHWLCGVTVQFDLTFTVKAWTEAERYHWLDIVTSQSTMHRITRFDLDTAYSEYTDARVVEIMKEKVHAYNQFRADLKSGLLQREGRNEKEDQAVLDQMYLEILYTNPCGMKLTAGMTTNYLQLKTVYRQRRYHRLPEWRAFCDWIRTLPHAELITGEEAA